MLQKNWHFQSQQTPSSKEELINILFKNRGINSKSKKEEFLNPTLSTFLNYRLPQTKKAVDRIKKAIEKNEQIIVYSDYDCDGICGTAILWETLYELGARVLPYIPHRIKEGYGLAGKALKELAKNDAKVVITVDHGITAVKEAELAKKLGIDLIITDHHLPPSRLPNSYAIVHATQLCGASVAFLLAYAAWKSFGKSKEEFLDKLDLATIATISDMVPLKALNRTVVKFGLNFLQNTKRPGLLAISQQARINPLHIGTFEISHIIAPRLNASGRLENAIDSLRLLCTKRKDQADQLAKHLDKVNARRQKMTETQVNLAKEIYQGEEFLGILAHEDFHEGVIGLVAQKLTEQYHRPMVVIAQSERFSKGSARSVPGFDIVEALRSCSEFLVEVGGHPQAAGFKIESKKIEIFKEKITQFAQNNFSEETLSRTLDIDCPLELEKVNQDWFLQIQKLEPFGVGNPEPLFLSKDVVLDDVRTVGQNSQHLKFQVLGFDAIGFSLGDKKPDLRPGDSVDIVYALLQDNWNGGKRLQLKIKDLRKN